MSQGSMRSGADGLTFHPFCSSALSTSNVLYSSLNDTGPGSSIYGNIIDLQSYSGFQTCVVAMGVRGYQASSNVSSSQEAILTGHFVTDTSSAFGGSTTLGSTFTLSLKPSSAQSSEEGVFVASVNLNDAGCYRYLRAIVTVELTSGDGETVTISPVYILTGRDTAPTTHNVQFGGVPSTA